MDNSGTSIVETEGPSDRVTNSNRRKNSKDASRRYQDKVRETIDTLDLTIKEALEELLSNINSSDEVNSIIPFLQIMKEEIGGSLKENTREEIFRGASNLIRFLAKEHVRNATQRYTLISVCKETLAKFSEPELQTVMENLNVQMSKGHAGDSGTVILPDALEEEIEDGNIFLIASVMIDYTGYIVGLAKTVADMQLVGCDQVLNI